MRYENRDQLKLKLLLELWVEVYNFIAFYQLHDCDSLQSASPTRNNKKKLFGMFSSENFV